MACNPDCRKANGRQCHCSVCHRTFTGISTFDQHRVGGTCVIGPRRVLSEKDGVWGSWGSTKGKVWWSQ